MIFANLEKEDREKIINIYLSELADVFDMLDQDETIDIYFEEMSPPYAASVLARCMPIMQLGMC